VHLILDNDATHKTPQIKNWLTRHPRFHLHFTPTGASWINLVERCFAELTASTPSPHTATQLTTQDTSSGTSSFVAS
jgi:transposase